MASLKVSLRKELREKLAEDDAEINELQEKIRMARLAASGVTGGLFATAALNATDKRIQERMMAIGAIRQRGAWAREMLEKY